MRARSAGHERHIVPYWEEAYNSAHDTSRFTITREGGYADLCQPREVHATRSSNHEG